MHRRDRLPRLAALVLGLASALAATPPALAQNGGEKAAAAQALFDEAIRLMKLEQNAAACPKLEESQRLDPGMGTEFRLAECYEKVGKLASAWATFVSVADASALARQPEREGVARKRAEALAPRLARLSISVPIPVAALPGLEVLRDGTPVGKALWDVAVPVDPGEHVVTARAPGMKVWEGRVAAPPAAASLVVAIQPLEALPQALPPPTARRGRSTVPAIMFGGVAALGVGIGVGLFVAHSGAASDAQTLSTQIKGAGHTCAPTAKTPDSRCGTLADKASSADTLGDASSALFVVGGIAAAVTVVTLVLPGPTPTPAAGNASNLRIRLSPALGGGMRGLFATGSF